MREPSGLTYPSRNTTTDSTARPSSVSSVVRSGRSASAIRERSSVLRPGAPPYSSSSTARAARAERAPAVCRGRPSGSGGRSATCRAANSSGVPTAVTRSPGRAGVSRPGHTSGRRPVPGHHDGCQLAVELAQRRGPVDDQVRGEEGLTGQHHPPGSDAPAGLDDRGCGEGSGVEDGVLARGFGQRAAHGRVAHADDHPHVRPDPAGRAGRSPCSAGRRRGRRSPRRRCRAVRPRVPRACGRAPAAHPSSRGARPRRSRRRRARRGPRRCRRPRCAGARWCAARRRGCRRRSHVRRVWGRLRQRRRPEQR